MPELERELCETHLALADLLFLQGRHGEARDHFSRAMFFGADRIQCLMGSGLSSMGLGFYSEALPIFGLLESDSSARTEVRCLAAINRGVCQAKTGDASACLSSMDDALKLFGDGPSPIRLGFGGVAYMGSRHMIHFTKGTAHCMLGDFASAVKEFELALEDESGGVLNGLNVDVAKVELAYCRMKMGVADRRSWELHERRWWTGRVALERVLNPPINFGDPAGKTVMVYSEQGYGDSIQFSRFIRGLKGIGASKVVLVTHQPLARLLSRVGGVDEVAVSGQPHSSYGLHLPVMSLPHALGVGGNLGLYSAPYIGVDPSDAEAWRARLPEGAKVGLVWSGDPKMEHSDAVQDELRKRNIPLKQLVAHLLAACDGLDVNFVSLQKDDRDGQLADFPNVFNPMTEVGDYYDTACIIANLDFVVTVDTSVAHLAGAMGKPVWMFSRHRGCWRWGSDGSCLARTWYPSMRIWRETEYDNWGPIIESAAAEFRASLDSVRS